MNGRRSKMLRRTLPPKTRAVTSDALVHGICRQCGRRRLLDRLTRLCGCDPKDAA